MNYINNNLFLQVGIEPISVALQSQPYACVSLLKYYCFFFNNEILKFNNGLHCCVFILIIILRESYLLNDFINFIIVVLFFTSK